MRILISGGGTAGSVMPLVAIASELQKQQPDTQVLFVGTRSGQPEKKILTDYNFRYIALFGGKIRRYFDIRNISDIILIIIGFFQSLAIMFRFKPEIVCGAGGYISVPVIWAAWMCRKKILIHQQDIRPSLSNILTMPLADRITVTFERSLQDFPASKTVWTGNPARGDILQGNREAAYQEFHLKKGVPIILVIGGGTGAVNINSLLNQALSELVQICQIVHLTGAGKHVTGIRHEHYQQHEFLTSTLKDILLAADLVISRAGLSTLTEFSLLKKPVILIPLPDSHQEANAEYYAEKNAAIVMTERTLSPTILARKIRELLEDKKALALFSENIGRMIKPDATQMIVEEINNLVGYGSK